MPKNEMAEKHFSRMYQHTVRNPNGYSISMGPDGKVERDTQQCCHCNQHFDVVPGSGKRRGYCMLCNKVTCGSPQCHEHFPFEKRMDLYEKGLIPDLMASSDMIVAKHKKFILTE